MLTCLVVLIIAAILVMIKSVRGTMLELGILATVLLPFAWLIFVIWVITHFVRKFW